MRSRGWLSSYSKLPIIFCLLYEGQIEWLTGLLVWEANVVLKICKIRLHIEYYTQTGSRLSKQENCRVLLGLDYPKKREKIIQIVKDYSYKEIFHKLELTTLLDRNMQGDPTETFKINYFFLW